MTSGLGKAFSLATRYNFCPALTSSTDPFLGFRWMNGRSTVVIKCKVEDENLVHIFILLAMTKKWRIWLTVDVDCNVGFFDIFTTADSTCVEASVCLLQFGDGQNAVEQHVRSKILNFPGNDPSVVSLKC